jgi:hypothetical protein
MEYLADDLCLSSDLQSLADQGFHIYTRIEGQSVQLIAARPGLSECVVARGRNFESAAKALVAQINTSSGNFTEVKTEQPHQLHQAWSYWRAAVSRAIQTVRRRVTVGTGSSLQ